MATPSTATATIRSHNPHYGYSHHHQHQPYQTGMGGYGPNDANTIGSPRRLSSGYANLTTPRTQDSTLPVMQTPSDMNTTQAASTGSQSSKRGRRPNWNEFYKNGPPKEIIVIDDDSPAPERYVSPPSHSQSDFNTLKHNLPHARGSDNPEPVSKKRRTGAAQASGSKPNQASYSNVHTPHEDRSESNTVSTDRTTSLHTTAPTSLGSHGSGDTLLEEGVVGQKRKRVTRQSTADEKKRKEIEVIGDAYSHYIPPPKPPIKAKEVYVQPVRDVSMSNSYKHLGANPLF